ncbi:hypothetical protein EYC80_000520 [Monilinia laxa]|uniref:Uncharacterized protein n=1 Tax=Monilinia laxa TaxID=61186 RepID=A0A5N6KAX9_MONLA|nr:hypothetical protein EYC80_000520 [Monilinia laxa]
MLELLALELTCDGYVLSDRRIGDGEGGGGGGGGGGKALGSGEFLGDFFFRGEERRGEGRGGERRKIGVLSVKWSQKTSGLLLFHWVINWDKGNLIYKSSAHAPLLSLPCLALPCLSFHSLFFPFQFCTILCVLTPYLAASTTAAPTSPPNSPKITPLKIVSPISSTQCPASFNFFFQLSFCGAVNSSHDFPSG